MSRLAPRGPPATFVGGRYTVRRFLGEGSRKRVYLAHDLRLDRDVAFALIKTDGLDEAGLARIRREAQTMGRLGDHPHIVTVHDIGDEGSQPYIVSQYMAGGSVDDWLQRTEQHRLPVDQCVRVAEQLCQALEYAHTRNVIHRDLKPGNVWLTEDGTAKLGDFGLAVAVDRSRLTIEGMMVGTVAYMPPEQALGRSPDPRSDLYALGAMLYEMLTGRPPFIGDDIVAIISQHINTPPVAPSWHNAEVPRSLEVLILRLLAKVPEDRPANAAAVSAALATITPTASASAERVIHTEKDALEPLAEGIFVGRREEMTQLKNAVEDALSGRGRLLMLAGDPGIGKTRTAEEIATYARLRTAQVLVGRCYEGEGAPAFWPWVQMIRAYVHDREPAVLMAEMGPGAVAIAQVVSEVRERLPDLPNPPPLEGEQARFRLFDSITMFLKNAAKTQPLVLVLDDLHWADKASLMLLQFLAREIADARLLLIGTYRDLEVGRQHPLAQTLAELARERLSQRVLLRGLEQQDVSRFIEMTASVTAPSALVAAVYTETEGNPLFISEVVRLLVTEGRLARAEETRSWSVGIPQSVREVIGRRLDRLSKDASNVLGIASVVGRDFSLNVLERIADLEADRLLEVLDEALAARVVAEVPRAVGRYRFTHGLIRETLYDDLSLARRVRLHRQIGEVLESVYRVTLETHLAELAYHFFQAAQGGDVNKAINYATGAGHHASARLAYEEAASHYERALEVSELTEPDEHRRCELLLALGDAFWKAGDRLRARDTFQHAAEVARKLGAPAELARAAVGFAGEPDTGRFDESSARLLEEALTELEEHDSAVRARVMARLAHELGMVPESQDRRAWLSEEAVGMARRLGDAGTLANALSAMHFANYRPDNLDTRLDAAHEIVRLADSLGDRELALDGHAYLVVDRMEVGDISAVDREIETHARLANQLRQPQWLWYPLMFRATRATMDGRFAEVEPLVIEALRVAEEAQDPNAAQFSVGQLGFVRMLQGHAEETIVGLQAAVELYAWNTGWRAVLAYTYMDAGREQEARAELERLAANEFADLKFDTNFIVVAAVLAPVCANLNDVRRAGILYQLLLPYESRNVVVLPGMCFFGSVAYFLGFLATTTGNWTEAAQHFEAAYERHARMGARPLAASTQYEYAHLLLKRDQRGDRQRAQQLLTEALAAAHDLGMKTLTERVVALKLGVQGIGHTDLKTSIDGVAAAVQQERPNLGSQAAADGTTTILFSDIEGSTAMSERLGDRRWLDILHAHNLIIRERLTEHCGHEVKSQGDGFMLAFTSPRYAVAFAISVQRAFAAYSDEHPQTPIRVRIGLHTGEVIREDGDFFGRNVNLAARIANEANGGEILASSAAKERTESISVVKFGQERRVALKGLVGTHAVHAVEWTEGNGQAERSVCP